MRAGSVSVRQIAPMIEDQLTGREVVRARRSTGGMFVLDFARRPGAAWDWSLVGELTLWSLTVARRRIAAHDSEPELIGSALGRIEGRKAERVALSRTAGDLRIWFERDAVLSLPARRQFAGLTSWFVLCAGMFSFGVEGPGRFRFEAVERSDVRLSA
jgi:hypothetical protein